MRPKLIYSCSYKADCILYPAGVGFLSFVSSICMFLNHHESWGVETPSPVHLAT